MNMKLRLSVLAAVILFFICVFFPAISGAIFIEKDDKPDQENIPKNFGRLPLYFIENKGQLDPKVKFYVKTPGQTIYFTDEGIVFDLFRQNTNREKTARKEIDESGKNHQSPEERERLVFSLSFNNHQGGIVPEGLDQQSGKINYFIGNDKSKWKTDIPSYKGLLYRGIYKGIDLKLFGTGRNLEYEFIVHPGANPKDILLTYDGIEGIRKNEEGELLIGTAFGELREMRPYIYQEIDGKRMVDGSFEIKTPVSGLSQTPIYSFGFTVASYDLSHPLIIDPVLVYSTYLGGSGDDYGWGVAVDSSGSAYVTGSTNSTDFPVKNAYQGHQGGYNDAFVIKIDPSGSTLSYSTYLGGGSTDFGRGIAVDSLGCVYVTGWTASPDFPTKNAYQGYQGDRDAFVTKLDSSGSELVYSSFLGGNDLDHGNGIAVDSSGSAYVTGYTNSTDFPTSAGAFCGTHGGGEYDAFVTKLDPSGNTFSYSTYLGGSGNDYGWGVAVDSSGSAYVTGYTNSTNFPVKNVYQEHQGCCDAFLIKIDPSGSTLSYSTYLGGSGYDYSYGIAVDSAGCAYVTGETLSGDFPTENAFQESHGGGVRDAFVIKIYPSGSTLSYSTYLGGSGYDYSYGIAVDSSGSAYVTGSTNSTDFPFKNAYQGHQGGYDAFVAKFDQAGKNLAYSTCLGGGENDGDCSLGYGGIAIDSSGNAYVTGSTNSTDFPVKNAYQGHQGGYDTFITKIIEGNAPVPTLQYSWNMDADPGWSTEGLWAWGQPTGGGGQSGGPDPTGGYTGANVYGYNLSGNYENELPERHLTTGAIDCRRMSEVTLKFRRWLGVEQSYFDHAYVRVSNDGITWTDVWENSTSGTEDSSWSIQEFDISSVADGQATVYLRWTMGTTDDSTQYCGWNIDDVEICAVKKCVKMPWIPLLLFGN